MADRSEGSEDQTDFPTGLSTVEPQADPPQTEIEWLLDVIKVAGSFPRRKPMPRPAPCDCPRCAVDPRRERCMEAEAVDQLPRLILDHLVHLDLVVPLEIAQALTYSEMVCLLRYITDNGGNKDPMRLVLGAALVQIRSRPWHRRQWMNWLESFLFNAGSKYPYKRIRRWMAEARDYYGLTQKTPEPMETP